MSAQPRLSVPLSGSGVHVGMTLGGDSAHFSCLVLGKSPWVSVFQELVLLNIACLNELLCIVITKACSSCEKLSEVLCFRT